jgi:hypothetical protein
VTYAHLKYTTFAFAEALDLLTASRSPSHTLLAVLEQWRRVVYLAGWEKNIIRKYPSFSRWTRDTHEDAVKIGIACDFPFTDFNVQCGSGEKSKLSRWAVVTGRGGDGPQTVLEGWSRAS